MVPPTPRVNIVLVRSARLAAPDSASLRRPGNRSISTLLYCNLSPHFLAQATTLRARYQPLGNRDFSLGAARLGGSRR